MSRKRTKILSPEDVNSRLDQILGKDTVFDIHLATFTTNTFCLKPSARLVAVFNSGIKMENTTFNGEYFILHKGHIILPATKLSLLQVDIENTDDMLTVMRSARRLTSLKLGPYVSQLSNSASARRLSLFKKIGRDVHISTLQVTLPFHASSGIMLESTRRILDKHTTVLEPVHSFSTANEDFIQQSDWSLTTVSGQPRMECRRIRVMIPSSLFFIANTIKRCIWSGNTVCIDGKVLQSTTFWNTIPGIYQLYSKASELTRLVCGFTTPYHVLDREIRTIDNITSNYRTYLPDTPF